MEERGELAGEKRRETEGEPGKQPRPEVRGL